MPKTTVIQALCLLACVHTSIATPETVKPTLTALSGARLEPQAPMAWGPLEAFDASASVTVNRTDVLQTILGFGTALTETASFSVAGLNSTMRARLTDMLFAAPPHGNRYTLCRMHLDSADFSLSTYSLDNYTDDFELAHFDDQLTHESKYVLPFARSAVKTAAAAGAPLKLFFSPWSPPAWMKQSQPGAQSGSMLNSTHPTGLKPDPRVHAAWAAYFVRYTRALRRAGVPVWGATMQNEPLVHMTNPNYLYESCSYTAEDQRDFLRDHLGPALQDEGLVVMSYDWNKGNMTPYVAVTLEDEDARRHLGGVAFHWYAWRASLYLDELASLRQHPKWDDEKFVLLGTEACFIQHGVAQEKALAVEQPTGATWGTIIGPGPAPNGTWHGRKVAGPMSYAIGELYLVDAMGDMTFGAMGWTDWNAVLDYGGGPNHIHRGDISAPILVDTSTNTLYVQSMYYYIGHVSRFVPPGWKRIGLYGPSLASTPLDFENVKHCIEHHIPNSTCTKVCAKACASARTVALAFASPDGAKTAVVAMNVREEEADLALSDTLHGTVNVTLPGRSVTTLTY